MARNPFLVQQSRDAKAMTAMAHQIEHLKRLLFVCYERVEEGSMPYEDAMQIEAMLKERDAQTVSEGL